MDFLIVVAHPDDESLWFGGTLLRFHRLGLRGAVACITHGDDPIRRAEFRRACRVLKVPGIMLDYPDLYYNRLSDFTPSLKAELRRAGHNLTEETLMITHPPHGNERNHPHHVQCFEYLSRWSRREGHPLAFFSERLVGELSVEDIGVGLGRSARMRRVRLIAAPLSDLSMVPGYSFHKIWKDFREPLPRLSCWRSTLRKINVLFSIRVDLRHKQALLSRYPSQRALLRGFQTYRGAQEHLYSPCHPFATRLAQKLAQGTS